jgi:predicted nuclease with TOPRIM domain
MGDDNAGLLLALANENAELRQQLASAQDLLVETAIDAGQLHARIEALQAELTEMRNRRDAWRTEAMRLRDVTQRIA